MQRAYNSVEAMHITVTFRALVVACLMLSSAAGCAPSFLVPGGSFRVLVFNIHAGKDAAGRDNLGDVAALIQSLEADIVLLQEVDRGTRRSGGVDQLRQLMDATGYAGVFGRTLEYDGGGYGLAALSRRGFSFDQTRPLNVLPAQPRAGGSYEPRGALITVAKTGDGGVQAANTHLDASADDTYRMQEIAQLLLALSGRIPLRTPLVAGGDFNAEPGSPAIGRILEGGLRDAWTECGAGDGLTYPSSAPVKRIDYLFLADSARCTEARVVETTISDHRPLLVTVEAADQ